MDDLTIDRLKNLIRVVKHACDNKINHTPEASQLQEIYDSYIDTHGQSYKSSLIETAEFWLIEYYERYNLDD